jgi:hypothetical protein
MGNGPRNVNDDLVRQEIEKGRMGDRALAGKPGRTPKHQGGKPKESSPPPEDKARVFRRSDMSKGAKG